MLDSSSARNVTCCPVCVFNFGLGVGGAAAASSSLRCGDPEKGDPPKGAAAVDASGDSTPDGDLAPATAGAPRATPRKRVGPFSTLPGTFIGSKKTKMTVVSGSGSGQHAEFALANALAAAREAVQCEIARLAERQAWCHDRRTAFRVKAGIRAGASAALVASRTVRATDPDAGTPSGAESAATRAAAFGRALAAKLGAYVRSRAWAPPLATHAHAYGSLAARAEAPLQPAAFVDPAVLHVPALSIVRARMRARGTALVSNVDDPTSREV